MSATRVIVEGILRAARSPVMLLWLALVNFLVALPASLMIADSLFEKIGSSRVHEKLRAGFDMAWFGEYEATARGLESAFTPAVAGAGAFYDNMDAWLSGRLFMQSPGLLGLGAAYVLIWALMLGGVLDRFARPEERPGAGRFFRRGGRYFFRFTRLAAISSAPYVFVYLLARFLFEKVDEATREATAELTVFYYAMLVWTAVALLLVGIRLSFNYAKIATVVDERRSMLLATARGAGFVLLHPLRTLGLYAGLLLISGLGLAAYALTAPEAGPSTSRGLLLAFGVGQALLLFKLLMRLSLYAGQTALYRELGRPKPPHIDEDDEPAAQGEASPRPAGTSLSNSNGLTEPM